MHGKMGAAVLQRHFQLLDEQPFAAHLRQRFVEDLVTAGGHAEQCDGEAGNYTFQFGLDVMGLGECQRALAGSNDEGFAHAVRN